MDKSSFSERNDLVCSLPKDWLNLRPPSSGGVGNPFHCLDCQNSLGSFDTQDGCDHPLSSPLMRSAYWSNAPLSWPCPSARQDNLKTTLVSHPDDIPDNIKKNDRLEEDLSDCFHMTQKPDVTETIDTPFCDGICGLALCTGNQCVNFNIGACFGDQASKLPQLFTVCDQGSLESSMMVSGPENNYWGFTCSSCRSAAGNNHQEKLKMNCKVPHNQLQASIQFSELSSEGATDDWCSPVRGDFSMDTAFFPDQGSLTEDFFSPRSKMSSYPLYENTGSVSIPQVTGGLIESENKCGKRKCDCLPCGIHATISHDDCCQFDSLDWWSQRKIDEEVSRASHPAGHMSCIGFGYSQKMHTQENRSDDISAVRKLMDMQSSVANSKHCLLSPELDQSGSDQLDSVTDCHMLVENIWNSSLMLFAGHSCESDRLADSDVEILLCVIHSLSKYLTHRAGVSAKCIQTASQPDKFHCDNDSSISNKVFSLSMMQDL